MTTTLELAEACAVAYEAFTWQSYSDTQLNVVNIGDEIVFAFRGTEASTWYADGNWKDIVADLRFLPRFSKDVGWAHRGFLNAAEEAYKHILDKYSPWNIPPIMTGHSLGGAIAMVCATKLSMNGYDVRNCVTFGAPRCLRPSTRQNKFAVAQYVNKNDIVPSFMWWSPFDHVSWDQLGIRSTPEYRHRTWRDHGIEQYIQTLTTGVPL